MNAMPVFVALIRAVNVGGTGKMPMADLRELAEAAGFENVRTYIQSGNLLFTTRMPRSACKSILEQSLENYAGKPVGVILHTADELAGILKANPFPEAEPNKVGVLFLDGPAPTDMLKTIKGQTDEDIALGQNEVYIYFPSGMGRTKLRFAAMSEGTMRNINTLRKLLKMAAE